MLQTPSKIALSLVVLSVLALMVGVYTAVKPTPETTSSESESSSDPGLLSAISDITKGSHLMYVELSGPIMMDSENNNILGSSLSNAVKARKALEKAYKDDHVKGVLLGINSPGGTVGMSQELNAAVRRVAEKKPVVAYFGDMAASGGYYTGCAATKIVSNPGTITGSIGVIISTLNLKTLLQDKLGVRSYTIKSGRYKDILNPYRDATADELALIQNMINESYQQFLGAVIEGRTRYITNAVEKKRVSEQIKAIADGRIIIGSQAKKLGLVDELGDIDDAHKLLNRMSKERFRIGGNKERLPLEPYSEGNTLLDLIGLSSESKASVGQMTQGLSGQSWTSLMPLSLRFSSQPLWILE